MYDLMSGENVLNAKTRGVPLVSTCKNLPTVAGRAGNKS